jgi:excinuclease UvrABC helicase subunit UvrB
LVMRRSQSPHPNVEKHDVRMGHPSGKLESDMREAAKRFEFEKAAKLRDTIKDLRTKEFLFA